MRIKEYQPRYGKIFVIIQGEQDIWINGYESY